MTVFLNSQDLSEADLADFLEFNMPFCTVSRKPDNERVVSNRHFYHPLFQQRLI